MVDVFGAVRSTRATVRTEESIADLLGFNSVLRGKLLRIAEARISTLAQAALALPDQV